MHASANLTTKESYLLKAQLRGRFSIALYYVIKRKRDESVERSVQQLSARRNNRNRIVKTYSRVIL